MNRDDAKQEIKSRYAEYLTEAKKISGKISYICPLCNNGAGKDGTGMTIAPGGDGTQLHCFKCGFHGDIFDLYTQEHSCDFKEAFTALCNQYNIQVDGSGDQRTHKNPHSRPQTRQANYIPQEQAQAQELTEPIDNTGYYRECVKRLEDPAAITYLQARGISKETAAAYWIGYDPAADPAGSKHPAPRIIMPTSPGHYVARATDPTTPGKWAKLNNKGGRPAIFNAKVLQDSSKEAVFVVEGIFDALSIIEAGAAAIALCSTSNAGMLLEKLKEQRTAATLILCLDNDEAGKKATNALREGLQRLNISYITADICGGYKDPNEALTADKDAFTRAISEAQRQTAARPDNISTYINSIMAEEIQGFKKYRNRKTGFANLDEKAGGLYAGLYVIAAISSLGKTTFTHQIADQLAEAGEDVLFFSLEQSRLELVSKSIARRTAQKDLLSGVSSLSIRRGYLPDNVQEAAEEYQAAIGDRLSIIEGNFACNISFIGDYVRKYIKKTGTKPVIVIDYLQILQPQQDERGKTQSTKETVDTTVTELKRLSREQGLTVFVISSVNRSNYLTPIDFESLKESGGIEYTADVIWGLQLQALNDEIFDKNEKIKAKRALIKKAKAANPRKIELVCLKNRYGVSSFSCYFDYIPQFDLFTEGELMQEYADRTEAPTSRKRI